MTDAQIADCINKAKTSVFDRAGTTSFRIARAVESHHGITAQPQPQPRSDRIKTLRAELAELCEAEAKEAISGVPNDLRSECIALVQARLEVEAIKHYRAAVGCTLVEAKHAVDAMVAKHAAQAKEAQK